jgi:DNA repair photolyase
LTEHLFATVAGDAHPGDHRMTGAPTSAPAASSSAGARLRWTTLDADPERHLPGLDPAERVTHPEFQGIEFLHVRAKSLLNEVPAAAELPFRWTINTYRGCSHACTYCFARPSHEWLQLGAGQDFESVIVVKVNAVERLRAELRRPSWRGEPVALGTNTDPYQRAEGRYRLTRGVLETLSAAGNPFSVLTKGTLVTRDLDLLTEATRRGLCSGVSMSIPTLDEDVWRASEPGTPHPKARMETIAALSAAGIPTGVMVAPIIPGLSDDEEGLDRVVGAAVEAGASSLTPIVLHLRSGVRDVFAPWLADVRPDLVDSYREWYRGSYAPKRLRADIVGRFHRAVERHGPLPPSPLRRRHADARPRARASRDRPGPSTAGGTADQLRLL